MGWQKRSFYKRENIVKNNGTETWSKGQLFRLAAKGDNEFTFENPLYGGEQLTIQSSARVYLDPLNPIEPGEQFTFKFTVAAPDKAGSYKLSLGFVQDGVAWFGEQLTKTIKVENQAPIQGKSGMFISGKIPEKMNPAQKQEIEMGVRHKNIFLN